MEPKIQKDKALQIEKSLTRHKQLAGEREKILSLPADQALDRILGARNPRSLLHSFPDEDFYLLVHDIGPQDSMQLFALASDSQLEFLLDIESWAKDAIDLHAVTKWLNLLLRSNPDRFINWYLKEKTDIMALYLFRNMEVVIREHDQDPSEFEHEYFTFDDTFYIRFTDYAFGRRLEDNEKKDRDDFLFHFLDYLADHDHRIFHQALLETGGIIPAEAEEEAYRLRNVRLAERGFLPFEEAVGLYQHLDPRKIKVQAPKTYPAGGVENQLYPVPAYASKMFSQGGLFSMALTAVEDEQAMQQIQTEFAGLCNRIIVADRRKIQSRDELQDVVKKACEYISLGLKRLMPQGRISSAKEVKTSAALIARHPLEQLFRVGFGLALELKWRAEKWRRTCWFESKQLPLSFWGEEWLGVLGGLLIKRPLFYDNYKTGVLYREFATLDDIRSTEKALSAIIAFDELLSRLNVDVKPLAASTLLNHKNLILTQWARSFLGLAPGSPTIRFADLKKLFAELNFGRARPGRISPSVKASFLSWLEGQTRLSAQELSRKLGPVFEALFNEIENEYSLISQEALDPKYIHLFLIKNRFRTSAK